MKPHLIYDFDGVLGDTAELNYRIIKSLHPEIAREAYLIDHHRGNVFERPVVPFNDVTRPQFYEQYNAQLKVVHLAAAHHSIRALGEMYHQHIVTSNCEQAIMRVLSEVGVAQLFTSVLGQEAHASKREKFRRIAREHGFDLKNALFITDTLGDLIEAAAEGLPSIAVTFGYHPREVLAEGLFVASAETWIEVEAQVRTHFER